MTADIYLEKLKKEIVPAIESQANLRKMFYMHDGAPAHYTKSVRAFLDDKFRDQWIGRRGPIEWPARSPDLTPTDFFLWGFLKDRVYATKHQTLQALEHAIITEMRSVSIELCRRVCQSVPERLQLCKESEGGHIEQFL